MNNPEIITISGEYFQYLDPLDQRGTDIDVIAHALANTCRFCGHVDTFYSVAQHSVLASYLADQHPFTALMHDASEAYLTDVPSPIKAYIPGYIDMERHIMARLAQIHGFQWPEPPDVKTADLRLMITEGRDLTAAGRDGSWRQWPIYAEPLEGRLPEPLPPGKARQLFLDRYYELTDQKETA